MSAYNRNKAAAAVVEYLNRMPTPTTRPFGYENQIGISYSVKAGDEAVADFKDRIGAMQMYSVALGSAGKVGQVIPLTTNRITLPDGFHRRVILRGSIPQLTTNCLFASGATLIRAYTLSIGAQTQVYYLTGGDIFHLMYHLEQDPQAASVARNMLYTGVLSPYTFNPPGADYGDRPRKVNYLTRGDTTVLIPLPTPWYGSALTDKNKSSDYWVMSDLNRTEIQVRIEIEDYNASWRADGGDPDNSDRALLPTISWDLLFEYIPRSEPAARYAKALEIVDPMRKMVPTFYPYSLEFVPPSIPAGSTASINYSLGDLGGLNLWMTVRVLDAARVDVQRNSVTDFVPISRAEISVPGAESIIVTDMRTHNKDVFQKAFDRDFPFADENGIIFAFNPALSVKAIGGYLDFQEKSPTLKLTVPNTGTTAMNVRVQLLLGQLAFWGMTDDVTDRNLSGLSSSDVLRLDGTALKSAVLRRGEEFIH